MTFDYLIAAEQPDLGPQSGGSMKDEDAVMSYMDPNVAFAPAGGMQELSFDEIEQVNGGLLWLVPIVVPIVVAAVTVVAVKSTDDCTTNTWEHTHKDGTKHKVEKKTCD